MPDFLILKPQLIIVKSIKQKAWIEEYKQQFV